jgi:hypothetical protein
MRNPTITLLNHIWNAIRLICINNHKNEPCIFLSDQHGKNKPNLHKQKSLLRLYSKFTALTLPTFNLTPKNSPSWNSCLCIKAKSASFPSESEFSGLKTDEDKGSFCRLNFLGDRTNYKAKGIIGKITNLFCIYRFQIDKCINTY